MQEIAVANVTAQVALWAGEGRSITLLDVREPWEVAAARIDVPGARLACVPMQTLPARHSAELDRAETLLVLCHHGMRSWQVTQYLFGQGYPHVYNIGGGIDAWSRLVDPSVPRY